MWLNLQVCTLWISRTSRLTVCQWKIYLCTVPVEGPEVGCILLANTWWVDDNVTMNNMSGASSCCYCGYNNLTSYPPLCSLRSTNTRTSQWQHIGWWSLLTRPIHVFILLFHPVCRSCISILTHENILKMEYWFYFIWIKGKAFSPISSFWDFSLLGCVLSCNFKDQRNVVARVLYSSFKKTVSVFKYFSFKQVDWKNFKIHLIKTNCSI